VAEETITRAVMVTVMLSIFAHGCSALPGMALYTRKVATLAATSPENRP
jgi:sodium/hydrogen antiporter